VFLETSALLRAVFQEQGGDGVEAKLRSSLRVVASRLIRVEAERALLRLALDGGAAAAHIPAWEYSLRRLWPVVDFFEMTAEICELAGRIAPRCGLRSLDAIHVATFHRVQQLEPGIELLSFDDRVLAAATGLA
jgi:predicted nucleic acid-binding protein